MRSARLIKDDTNLQRRPSRQNKEAKTSFVKIDTEKERVSLRDIRKVDTRVQLTSVEHETGDKAFATGIVVIASTDQGGWAWSVGSTGKVLGVHP